MALGRRKGERQDELFIMAEDLGHIFFTASSMRFSGKQGSILGWRISAGRIMPSRRASRDSPHLLSHAAVRDHLPLEVHQTVFTTVNIGINGPGLHPPASVVRQQVSDLGA
jgi:hypothetical protein